MSTVSSPFPSWRIRGKGRVATAAVTRKTQTRDWYRISAHGSESTEVMLFDEIGYYGVSGQQFIAELQAITTPDITLRINSPGGEVFDGIAIYHALKRHPAAVTVHVDGIAASIASVIAMAGDRIVMESQTRMMIHDASGLCAGTAADMTDLARTLDGISADIAAIYAARAGSTSQRWRAAMRAETWYSADEAVAAGLADEVGTYEAAARFDAARFRSLMREAFPSRRPAAGFDVAAFRAAVRSGVTDG